MKTFLAKKRNIFLARLFLGQLPFSFMHGPSNVPSFIFYLLGGLLLGFAYKKSQNLWVSTLVHMLYNSWPLLYYL